MQLFELNNSLFKEGVPLASKDTNQYTNATIIAVDASKEVKFITIISDAGNVLSFEEYTLSSLYGVPMHFINNVIEFGLENAIELYTGGTWKDKAKSILENWQKFVKEHC